MILKFNEFNNKDQIGQIQQNKILKLSLLCYNVTLFRNVLLIFLKSNFFTRN